MINTMITIVKPNANQRLDSSLMICTKLVGIWDMIPAKIRAMQTLGVPYPEDYDKQAVEDLMSQAQQIVNDLKISNIDIEPTKQMVAMIAYMHKLGRDIAPPSAEVVKSSTETE